MLRLVHAWLLIVLGASAVVAGALLFTARDAPSSPPHHDMAGPTDFSGVDVTLIAIVMIVAGGGLVALGWWIISARSRRTSSSPPAR